MEKNPLGFSLHREADGSLQQFLSDTPPPVTFKHRHPADFRLACANDDPGGPNASPLNLSQEMNRDSVIFVELQFLWDILLADENPQTNRSCLANFLRRKKLFNDDL